MAEKPVPRFFILDIIVIVILVIVVAILETPTIKPAFRGFYCDDDSIRYPYRDSTVSTGVLMVVTVLLPIIVIVLVETFNFRWGGSKRCPHRSVLCQRRVPPVVQNSLCYLALFTYGGLVTTFLTEVAKVVVGRLRPHFIDICQPDVNATMCIGNVHTYFLDYTCLGSDAKLIQDARKSFPSGHASVSMYSAVFLSLYFYYRCPKISGSRLFSPIFQLLFIMWGWYVGLSRFLDNKHHATDILAGYAIGTIFAVMTAHYGCWFEDPLADYKETPGKDDHSMEEGGSTASDVKKMNPPPSEGMNQSV